MRESHTNNRLLSSSDIDECRDDPQICGDNAICNNQPGTFRCECEDGYQFGSDGRTCVGTFYFNQKTLDRCISPDHADFVESIR